MANYIIIILTNDRANHLILVDQNIDLYHHAGPTFNRPYILNTPLHSSIVIPFALDQFTYLFFLLSLHPISAEKCKLTGALKHRTTTLGFHHARAHTPYQALGKSARAATCRPTRPGNLFVEEGCRVNAFCRAAHRATLSPVYIYTYTHLRGFGIY